MELKLWYNTPAQSFSEALPLGNGSMGAMVYGGAPEERISLNLDTLWSGNGKKEVREIAEEKLIHVRNLIRQERFYDAQCYMEKEMLGTYNESYMPAGNLRYEYTGMDYKEIRNYRRELDIERAVHRTSFCVEETEYSSEVFVSYPDKAICIEHTCGKKGGLNMTVRLDSPLMHQVKETLSRGLYMYGTVPSHVEPNYVPSECPIIYDKKEPGMQFGCMLGSKNTDGEVEYREGGLIIKNATKVRLVLFLQDGFRGYGKELMRDEAYMESCCRERVQAALDKKYEEIKERHIRDYQVLYHKLYLELGSGRETLPTDERLKRFRKEGEDMGLITLFFQYGRYLLISSSRKGSQPANLQGIWNESERPVWSSNLTVNINTQMNYWPVGICNLMECFEPFITLVQELSIAGQETAGKQFRCRGWVCNHNVDLWRQTTPVGGSAKYAYWPMGGVWLTVQLYDYYRYSMDKEFLRNTALPIMRTAVEFCLDWLVEEADGSYHTLPSTSPEISFWDREGRECYVGDSSAMDISLIAELFRNLLEALRILEIKDEIEEKVLERKNKLIPLRIDNAGMLCEWDTSGKAVDEGHRHFSPLIAMHTGEIINKEDTPELYAAGKKLLANRLRHGSGHIGWSCAWLISMFAKMGDGENAACYLEQLMKNSLYTNLFDLHPPLGENEGEREVFQIDGNLGGIYGVATMLLYNERGVIELLPALPAHWKRGAVRGLMAQGGFECSIQWEEGRLTEARIFSRFGGTLKIRSKYPISIVKDNRMIYGDICSAEFATVRGDEYIIL